MTKIKLIVDPNSVTSFEQPWIRPLIQDLYEIVKYDPNCTYNKQDVVLATYQTGLEPAPWYQQLINNGHLLVEDHLWDSDVDTASKITDNKLTLRNGNWLWYYSSIEWNHHTYDQYRPNYQYQYTFLMPINKRRQHRDITVRTLAPVLDQALYSYVELGRELLHADSRIAPWVTRFDPAWYDTSCYSVVCESYMRSRNWLANPTNYKTEISEKSFKPIAFYHPFIIVGSADTLKYLQREGFCTYSNLWDESYDTIVNDHDRLNTVLNTILETVKQYPKDRFQIDPETQRRLQHNHDHFFDQVLVKRRFQQEIVQQVQEFIAQ